MKGKNMIPKIIHYCWLSNDSIPDDLNRYVAHWKEILPDYEFIKWDFNRFDKKSSLWVSEAFDKKKYAFACDYIRLYAVYNFGGIYLDMDIEVVKSFDMLLNQSEMFAYEGKRNCGIEAGCFGSEKNDLFIGQCLKYYENRHFIMENGDLDTLPLPKIMQKIYSENHYKFKMYTSDYFTAKSFNTGIVHRTQNTYAIHHFAGSWKNDAEKKRIEKRHYLTKKYGWLGRNYAEFIEAKEDYGLRGVFILMKTKIQNKL